MNTEILSQGAPTPKPDLFIIYLPTPKVRAFENLDFPDNHLHS